MKDYQIECKRCGLLKSTIEIMTPSQTPLSCISGHDFGETLSTPKKDIVNPWREEFVSHMQGGGAPSVYDWEKIADWWLDKLAEKSREMLAWKLTAEQVEKRTLEGLLREIGDLEDYKPMEVSSDMANKFRKEGENQERYRISSLINSKLEQP